jgi:4-amino-4-deoxy-L-arabinose transferase-like glycosyltransferase
MKPTMQQLDTWLARLGSRAAFTWVFPLIWLLLNALQALATELFHDEAYYWMFSRQLSWVYAEHPPMIALWIRLGAGLLPGELGVRLLPLLFNALAIHLILRLFEPVARGWAGLMIASMVVAHVGGFFAAPDAPLAFFLALFFVLWRSYLAEDRLSTALLLGLVVAAMLYSKYHGAMILFFSFWAWPRVALRRSFWLLAALAALLIAPLLYGLYQQQFGTFFFHLGDRVRKPWSLEFPANFLLGQLLLYGPLSGLALLPAAFAARSGDRFQKSLKFSFVGVLAFLALMSFRAWIEANWSAGIFIPLLLLSWEYVRTRPRWRFWTLRLALPGLLLALGLRLHLVAPFVPGLNAIRNEVQGWEEWAGQIAAIAGGEPVAFTNSYARPSKYTFYTGKLAAPLNNFAYHGTQYEIWGYEDSLRGRDVWLFTGGYCLGCETVKTATGQSFYYKRLRNFQSYQRVRISGMPAKSAYAAGDTALLRLRLENGYPGPLLFQPDAEMPPALGVHFLRDGGYFTSRDNLLPLSGLTLDDSLGVVLRVPLDLPPGEYEWICSVQTGWLFSTINGSFGKLTLR